MRAELRKAGLGDGSLLREDDAGGSEAAGGAGDTAARAKAAAVKAQQLDKLQKAAIELRTAAVWGQPSLAGEKGLDAALAQMRSGEAEKSEKSSSSRRAAAIRMVRDEGGQGQGKGGAALDIVETDDAVTIGNVRCERRRPSSMTLVPRGVFFNVTRHVEVLRDMLLDWSLGHHLLLIGNQGVGKNKLADRMLELLRAEREYVQLHRDTTVASLTLRPVLQGGAIQWEDSPLVRAARLGRVLMVDEADKAPLEVVCVLKALVEDGELTLGDGRRLLRRPANHTSSEEGDDGVRRDGAAAEEVIWIHEDFRMLVLANRPGFPFLGLSAAAAL